MFICFNEAQVYHMRYQNLRVLWVSKSRDCRSRVKASIEKLPMLRSCRGTMENALRARLLYIDSCSWPDTGRQEESLVFEQAACLDGRHSICRHNPTFNVDILNKFLQIYPYCLY